jgi:hypothetical protein
MVKEDDRDLIGVTMQNTGFNIHVEIINNTSEEVILAGSMGSTPTSISPCIPSHIRLGNFHNNDVVIRIYQTENGFDITNKRKNMGCLKTVIRVDARKLASGMVFIHQLHSYLTTLSHYEVARRAIAEDSIRNDWHHLDVIMDKTTRDPSLLYDGFSELSRNCVRRQDVIQVRVGNMVNAKEMRVSILDSYFSPFLHHRLAYDPTLGDDDFIIEHLRSENGPSFEGTFTELEKCGSIYVDQNQIETISGLFCGMVVFKDAHHLASYFHKRKSIERFREESIYLAKHSGDIRLKQEISDLESNLEVAAALAEEQRQEIISLKSSNKDSIGKVRLLEKTIDDLKTGYGSRMSAGTIQAEIELGHRKLDSERDEILRKDAMARSAQKAADAKNRSEILKTALGVVGIVITGLAAILAAWQKLKAIRA